MKVPYQLNHEYKTVALTKDFAKASSVYGSKEYQLLASLKADFPDYRIELRTIEKKKNKKAYKGLNYETMAAHIQEVHGEEALHNFLFQMDLNHEESGAYGKIKKWFIAEHEDFFKS